MNNPTGLLTPMANFGQVSTAPLKNKEIVTLAQALANEEADARQLDALTNRLVNIVRNIGGQGLMDTLPIPAPGNPTPEGLVSQLVHGQTENYERMLMMHHVISAINLQLGIAE